MRILAVLGLVLMLAGCASRRAPASVVAPLPPNAIREYIDLEPGWRLRIIAPITKSGTYHVNLQSSAEQGNVISLKASDDLIGYETAYWALTARPGGGVSVHLTSAEMTKEGKSEAIATPTRALVHVPKYARFLRIFYLTRKSAADHDMALLGAGQFARLEAFTNRLREAPQDACADQPRERIYCEWIPAGMAVRQQVPKIVDGVTTWPDR